MSPLPAGEGGSSGSGRAVGEEECRAETLAVRACDVDLAAQEIRIATLKRRRAHWRAVPMPEDLVHAVAPDRLARLGHQGVAHRGGGERAVSSLRRGVDEDQACAAPKTGSRRIACALGSRGSARAELRLQSTRTIRITS